MIQPATDLTGLYQGMLSLVHALGRQPLEQATGVGEVAHEAGGEVFQIHEEELPAAGTLHGVAQDKRLVDVVLLNHGPRAFGPVAQRFPAPGAVRIKGPVPQHAESEAQPVLHDQLNQP